MMLIGHIKQNKMTASYPSIIGKVLTELEQLDLDALALGRHHFSNLDSNKVWFVILEYNKSPLVDFKPEVHRYHSDLQIVLAGQETMAWSLDSGEHQVHEAYNETRDILFYEYQGIDLNYIKAIPGCFYLFPPNTVHITNIQDDDQQMVRKLVVKIHNDLLEITS